ncbi:TetR family transcriptional regulator [Flavobacterium rivuli WB 3.3-2 = DSM 21788]|uniref:TetR family transcriptional regulator n=1 Tax=Flavobacterium rivuli WB 3.3-2 = DSM 21788 TaxID=1121895 RepID=A0A0A2MI05_9FLAO|nr:TetR/AcrR family transcriptional regulator [Flavobacterium rivuli]KGO87955.1 TetR family transcriptional regulator [Flavobacterium rivuli WB 3.3-2 = DSM 21788]
MKEQILNKATEMFLTLGYKSVTMDEIATEMGISKKTIYQHFANKNDLVEASAMLLFQRISDGIDLIRAEEHNPIVEFFIIRNFLSHILKDETSSPLHQLQKFFPVIFKTLRDYQFDKMHDCMYENIERGIASGFYRPDINIDFVSRIYFSGVVATKDAQIFPENLYKMDNLTLQFLDYHLRSLVTTSGLAVLTKTIAENLSKKN